jgi:hypothetical protein
MSGKGKINTAILICSVFIFRILFIYACLLLSLTAHRDSSFTKKQSSAILKHRNSFEALNDFGKSKYSVVEIYEETTDNEDEVKLNPFFFLHLMYSLVASGMDYQPKRVAAFERHFSYSSSYRYLAFQSIRI